MIATKRVAIEAQSDGANCKGRPNILVLCVDQWQTHMQLPDAVEFPGMRRLAGC